MYRMQVKQYRYQKTIIFLVVLVILFFYLINLQSFHFSRRLYNKKSIKCYRYQGETLPDIASENVTRGKSIFFHDTACNSYINGKIVIKSREACAVESAARLNPDLDVYLLYTSPGVFNFEATESDRFLQALMTYDNVKIRHLNYEKFTNGTPVEKLYRDGTIESSKYAINQASNVLRLLTLWKYGGIYLDLDVVVLKNLEFLPPNFVGCESGDTCTNSVIGSNFNDKEATHNFMLESLMEMTEHFNTTTWGANGPGVITRVVKRLCDVVRPRHSFNKMCGDVKIFGPENFYPIPWRSWKEYVKEDYLEKAMASTSNSSIVYIWNKLSSSTKLPLDSKSAYATLARKYCPRVFQQCDMYL